MKKSFIFLLVAAFIVSCSQEDFEGNLQNEGIQSTVTTELEESVLGDLSGSLLRTTIGETGGIWEWIPGESMGLSKVASGVMSRGVEYTHVAGIDNQATFNGPELLIGSYLGYYPYATSTVKNNVITFDLPDQLQLSNGDFSNFGKCGFMYTKTPITLTARTQSVGGLKFSHAHAIIRFSIKIVSGKVNLQQIELKAASPIFRRTVTIGTDGKASYSNPSNTITLHTGVNGFTLNRYGEQEYKGLLFVPPTNDLTGDVSFDFNLVTDKGTVTLKKISVRLEPNGLYPAIEGEFASFNASTATFDKSWDGTASAPTIDGNTIYINRASELKWVSDVSNKVITGLDAKGVPSSFAGYTVTLKQPIDLANIEWTPIGATSANAFQGTLNSLGNSNITGLKISTGGVVGLVGYNKGSISKITVENSTVSGNDVVGVIVGQNFLNVTNCHINGCTVTGNQKVGGIVGYNYTEGYMYNCSTDAASSILGSEMVGGIAGQNNNDITDCTNAATVDATTYTVGGLVGSNATNGLIKRGSNSGRIGATVQSYAGGIVGRSAGKIQGQTMTNTGDIGNTAGRYIGGIAGDIATDNVLRIDYIFNSGIVSGASSADNRFGRLN